MPAEKNEEKQERLRKRRRKTGADALLRLSTEEMRTCQHDAWQLKLLLIKMPDCSRWVPFPQTERLAAESATEIDIKLQQMSALQCETKRLAAETITERDTRLYSEWETYTRLAAEITEERDARFECNRARHGEQQTVQSSLPLFQQRSIQAMMHKSHANMATLLGYISVMLALFPDFSLYPDKG